MRSLRAITALLANLLLLNLTVVEAGFTCAAPPGAPPAGVTMGAAAATGEMNGMPDMAAQGTVPQRETGTPHDRTPHGQSPDPDCDVPWAPAGCQSMVPCTLATLGTATGSAVTLPPSHAPVAGLDELAPPSVLAPPEPPPPRV